MVNASHMIPCALLALAGIGSPRMSPAVDYIPLELFELALKADLIVDGVVARFEDPSVDSRFDESFFATENGGDQKRPTFTLNVK